MDDRIAQLKHLSLADRVRQLGNPIGPRIAIGDYMNAMNCAINAASFRQLSPRPRDRVLEIGFGNRKLLSDLMCLAPDITYDGIDISELMVTQATAFNQALVTAGLATFHHASSIAIPFADEMFDRAIAVNTIYFWSEPIYDLTEIRRVLKSRGVLFLAAMGPAGAAHLIASGELFRTYDEAQLRSLLIQEAFRGSSSNLIAKRHHSLTGERLSASLPGPRGGQNKLTCSRFTHFLTHASLWQTLCRKWVFRVEARDCSITLAESNLVSIPTCLKKAQSSSSDFENACRRLWTNDACISPSNLALLLACSRRLIDNFLLQPQYLQTSNASSLEVSS
jgi:ubiquinone/menaquinone biosynthesis C-methylase UbiE